MKKTKIIKLLKLFITCLLWSIFIFGAFTLGSASKISEILITNKEPIWVLMLVGGNYKIFSILSLLLVKFGFESSGGFDTLSWVLTIVSKAFIVVMFFGLFMDSSYLIDFSLFSAFSVSACLVAYHIGKVLRIGRKPLKVKR